MSHLRRRGDLVDGILVPFSGPEDDSYGTYWDARTDFKLDMYAPQALLHFHGLRDSERHGHLLRFEVHDEGLYAEGRITLARSPLYALLDSGRAAWSSATMPLVASAPRPDGYIAVWPIVEGSIADASEVSARRGLTAADYARAVAGKEPYIRSVWGGWRMEPQDPKLQDNQVPKGAADKTDPPAGDPPPKSEETPKEAVTPTEDLTEQEEFARWKADKAKEERRKEMEEVARAIFTAEPEKPTRQLPAKGKESPVDLKETAIRVASPWDEIGILGMTMHYEAKAAFRGRGQDFKEEFDDKFFRALAFKVAEQWQKDEKVEQNWIATPREMVEVIPMRCIDQSSYRNWTRYLPHMRANEAMTSTLAGYGDELVPTLLSSALYYFMRLESRVANLFQSFMMSSQPFDLPKITSGPTFHRAVERTDLENIATATPNFPTSQIGTDDVRFSAGKLAAFTPYSEELVEDATISFAEMMARTYVEEMAHAFDYVLLNGDKAASDNISADGSVGVNSRIRVFDGIRKQIVTGDQLAVADIADDSILSIMALMGNRGVIGRDIGNLVCIIPPEVAYKLDALEAYEGLDKVGPQATLLTGQLGFWRSVPLIDSEDFPLTSADGTVAGAGNTKGSWIVANRRAIMIGMRRMPQLEQVRPAGGDGRFITASLRADIQLMEEGAAAMAFNSTV